MTSEACVTQSRGPELPSFLRKRSKREFKKTQGDPSYSDLLNRLRGELGFCEQEIALRWLLEQLDESHDLKKLIFMLLKEGMS